MVGRIARVATLSLLLLLLALPASAGADVGQARTSGGGPNMKYDRNASVVRDNDGLTYLFFARSELNCRRLPSPTVPGCPDNIGYDLFYKVSMDGGQDFGPATLLASNPTGPAGPFYGRTIAATRTDDGLHVFWANGGTIGSVYHFFKATGASSLWQDTGPVPDEGVTVFNIEAVARGQQVFLYSERCCGPLQGIYADRYAASGPALTHEAGPVAIPGAEDANLPKAIIDSGGVFRIAMVKPAEGGDFVSSSADGLTFTAPELAAPADEGAVNWDPSLVQGPGGVYYLYFAPDDGTGRQRIAFTTSVDFARWTATREVSPGQQNGTSYWDYWPEGFRRGNQVVLFYTSERGFVDGRTGSTYPTGQGHIWTTPGFGGLDFLGPAA